MPIAGAARRLAALLYDLLLVVALLFAGTALLLPLSGGEAITPATHGALAYLYRGYLTLLALGYFGYSWTHGGQTLGMMAWKIRLEDAHGRPPGWRAASGRFAAGLALVLLAGGGLWLLRAPGWSRGDAAGLLLLLAVAANYLWPGRRQLGTLQDRLCRSRVVRSRSAR